jgi:SAM-dependent methyltransferase
VEIRLRCQGQGSFPLYFAADSRRNGPVEVIPPQNSEVPEVCGRLDFRGKPSTPVRAGTKAKTNRFGTTLKRLAQTSRQVLGSFYYVCRGRRPFGKGYRHYKDRYLRRILENDELLHVFNASQQLPPNFGLRLDERSVEYPWLLSRLSRFAKQSRFLDAGSTLNFEFILQHPAVHLHKWSILTLSPESNCFWNLGVSYLYEDLRALPFQDDWFDGVTCISVIEHVGMDNGDYAGHDAYREKRPRDFLLAVSEMRRILRPGASLLLSVPFGRYENHGWLQQFDSTMVAELISEFRPQRIDKTFFRYTQQGWKLATEEECSDLPYVDGSRNQDSNERHTDPSDATFAVTAIGVACIELQK